jgi:hypothetical protein
VSIESQRVDKEKVEARFDVLQSASALALFVSSDYDGLNEAEKSELIAMAVRLDYPNELLTFFENSYPPSSTYNEHRQLAAGFGRAYRGGVITDADVSDLADKLGSQDSAAFVAVLAQDSESVKADGAVEAFGKAASAEGFEHAAALAFSSSEELIRRNLNTPEERRAAFEQVKDFLQSEVSHALGSYGEYPSTQSMYIQGLVGAGRLHYWSDTATNEEFDALLKETDLRVVQEAISRAAQIEGDDESNIALNVFGDAAKRLFDANDE